METISINGLILTAHHGVAEQERIVGNEFEVNVTLHVPSSARAMATDDLADTVNYAEAIEIVKREMAKPSKLIEAVALRIRQALEQAFAGRIEGGSITIAKLAPPVHAQLRSVSFTHQWQQACAD